MRRVFVDSNVFIYALGAEHPYRAPCRALVAQIGRKELSAETSVEVIQEVLHVRRSRSGGIEDAITRAREILAFGMPVHDLTRADLELSLKLLASAPGLSTRDAIHAATARNRGIDAILSADTELGGLTGLERIDPADSGAIAAIRATVSFGASADG